MFFLQFFVLAFFFGRGTGQGPEKVGPEGWEAQNFAFFFSRLRPLFSFFLPLLGQLAIDTILVSPLSRNDTAHPRCATVCGTALDRARTLKERRYPELAGDHGRARLVVLAGEIDGRFSSETAQFLRCLASDRVRRTPLILKGRIHAALMRRWSAMLGCAAARSYALSLLDNVPAGVGGPASANEVLRDDRHAG